MIQKKLAYIINTQLNNLRIKELVIQIIQVEEVYKIPIQNQ